MSKEVVETPLMKQYFQFKKKYPDAILLFRVGDFYETFLDDAVETSRLLGITLTRRANGSAQHVELAGFPHHALDTYLPRFIQQGKRVAICDQLEDPKLAKGLVKRGVTELITPGIALHDNVLENKRNTYLAAVALEPNCVGLALLDLSTGEFMATESTASSVDKLLTGYAPKEVLVERKDRALYEEQFDYKAFVCEVEDWLFTPSNNYERLLRHFSVQNLKGFGFDRSSAATNAAGAILQYLDLTQHNEIGHINTLKRINQSSYVHLDDFTTRSLELLCPLNEGGKSLCDILDQTRTPMGGRLLHHWIAFPLKNQTQIEERQQVVNYWIEHPEILTYLSEQLSAIGDLERLSGKISMHRITPREVVLLSHALAVLAPLKVLTKESGCPALQQLGEKIDPCRELRDRIRYQLLPDAPNAVGKAPVIATGVNAELDELRTMLRTGKDYLLHLQQRESERTGISSLKVGFNNVFGYYIEVRNTYKDKVPPEWIRKQTLVSSERYITEELKEYESKILGAEERILSLEVQLFEALLQDMLPLVGQLKQNSHCIACIDVLFSFAQVALDHHYCCPEINDSLIIDIKGGRHPVIEQQLPMGSPYIANDVTLDNNDCQIMVITGPNMSGKSAFLRQTALIVLLAQMGSFVPAERAVIGLVDSVFTRVGASDNISRGESTFMIEMQEAASILNNLTPRSLLLFDELGRGTSTFDGISIAWAIVEYLHNHPAQHPKTLFATHYHELNDLAQTHARVRNFNVSAREVEGNMIFLRKLEPGGSAHSFGIQVAKLAGMPRPILKRAKEVLQALEANNQQVERAIDADMPLEKELPRVATAQPSFFQLEDPLLIELRDDLLNIDINTLTPLEALNRLNTIKEKLSEI